MIVEPKITKIETLHFRAKFNPNVNMIVNLVFPAFFVPIIPLHYTLSRFTVFENHPKGRIRIFIFANSTNFCLMTCLVTMFDSFVRNVE